jgi:hypothetical protein
MIEVVRGAEKAVGIILDSASLMTGQCRDRGQQLLHAAGDPLIAQERSRSVPGHWPRRGDEEATSCPTC